MDDVTYAIIFVVALFGSPLIFAVWQVFQDQKNYKAIKEARFAKEGTPVEVLRLSHTGINYGSKPSSIPIKCNNENLILTGRSFMSGQEQKGKSKRVRPTDFKSARAKGSDLQISKVGNRAKKFEFAPYYVLLSPFGKMSIDASGKVLSFLEPPLSWYRRRWQ